MKSFHNNPTIKAKYLERITAHEKADEIVKGIYWEEGKGCAVGCTVEKSDGTQHSSFETELGLPEWLARLEDTIFEGLPNEEAKTFPRRFLEAINVGSDLTAVKLKNVTRSPTNPTRTNMKNSDKIILDLCGGTGAWSKPYKLAGYDVRVITAPEYDVKTYTPPR